MIEGFVLDDSGTGRNPEVRGCLCKSGVPLLLMFAGAATTDAAVFIGKEPFAAQHLA